MKVLVQWAQASPQDWVEVTAQSWGALPSKSLPTGSDRIDVQPGWVNRLNVQGGDICGYDHYAVELITGGGCRVTVWKDDPDDLVGDSLGEFYARVITFLPLAPDPRMGGAWNTRQSQVVYAGPKLRQFYLDNPTENTVVRSWEEFVPPTEAVRHGVWVSNMEQHDAALSKHGWREWTEGVPAEFVRNGQLVPQRPLGRYSKSQHTKTYGLRSTDEANAAHAATHENLMTRDAFGAAETESVVSLGGESTLGWSWLTAAAEPDNADWPDGVGGTYRTQLDVSAAGADQSYGFRTAGAASGHWSRQTSGGADQDVWTQTQSLFTLTGLKLASAGVNPGAGATTDRWEALLAVTRAASHGSQTLTLTYDADAFADGPWTAATTFTVSVGGAIAPTGALLKEPRKTIVGSISPSGALIKQVQKLFSGAIAPAGTLIKQVQHFLAGTISPTGALTAIKLVFVALAGSISPSGLLSKQVNKLLAGAVSPVGTLVKQVSKLFSGSITPAGTLATSKVVLQSLAGAISPTGALIKQAQKVFSASITPTGTLVKQVSKLFSGAISPSGVAATTKVVLQTFTGSITPSGAVIRQVQKVLSGVVAPTGTLVKHVSKFFVGSITPTGVVLKEARRLLTGSITPSGALALSKTIMTTLTGAISPSGVVRVQVNKLLAGVIAPTGELVKQVSKLFSGAIIPSGALTTGLVKNVSLSGSISPTGVLDTLLFHVIEGILGSLGRTSTSGKSGTTLDVGNDGRTRTEEQ